MNLSLINNIKTISKTQQNTLLKSKQEGYIAFLNKGIQLLKQAKSEKFRNKDLLAESFRSFIDALKLNRSSPDPYLCCAYILIIIQDFSTAQHYLTELKLIDPENPDAKVLQKQLNIFEQNQQSKTLSDKLAQAAIPLDENQEVDYDSLYEQVESIILAKTQEISQNPTPSATENLKRLRHIQNQFHNVQDFHADIMKKIKIIDEEIDISDLKDLLKPIESLLRRLNKIYNVSNTLYQLHKKLEQKKILVAEFREEIETTDDPKKIPNLEQNLEKILDEIDNLADQLDHLDQNGINISRLEQKYEYVVKDIEKVQETIEEVIERLSLEHKV